MPEQLPNLHLTHGQLLWAIRYGRDPDQQLKDQVRYLRTLGIPAAAKEKARGPGSRIEYDFFDLMEVGLAVTGLNFRFRPLDIAAVLVGQREGMRNVYRIAWTETPEAALYADWVKTRERQKALIQDEFPLRLHDRHGEKWGQIDLVSGEEANEDLPVFEHIERFAEGPPRRLIPIKRLMIQWVAWALEAPPTKPGPAARKE